MAKEPFTARVEPEILDRVRASVIGLQGQGHPITLAAAVESALVAWCEDAEARYNEGQPWHVSDRTLRPGRPLPRSTE